MSLISMPNAEKCDGSTGMITVGMCNSRAIGTEWIGPPPPASSEDFQFLRPARCASGSTCQLTTMWLRRPKPPAAKNSAASAKAQAQATADNLAIQTAQAKKLSADVQKTAAAQAAQNIHVEEKGTQTEDLPRPLSAVTKIVEEALSRNGYHIKVSIKTDQKAVYVTERKVSPPVSLEVAGSRNQYVLSLHALPSNITRLNVKADYDKLAQGGRILSVSAEEVAEIERSLIREINKALASPSKA